MTTAIRVVGQTEGNIAVWKIFPNEDPVRNAETGLTAEETKTSEVKELQNAENYLDKAVEALTCPQIKYFGEFN